MNPLSERHLIVGVTGGIAAYRAVELVRDLQKRDIIVRVVMTRNACHFVGPLTFESLTGFPVVTEMFDETSGYEPIRHTALADWADGIVIAPATANIIAKAARGIADDFLSTLLLACNKPLLIAPAMNPRMFGHPATEENIRILKQRGALFAGPDTGDVACGHHGPGKMSPPHRIADLTAAMLGRNGDFQGLQALVTAGPTRENIDPVRFISNRSSGKMGYAIAAALVERGATVTLISGPVSIEPHAGVRIERVQTAAEMHKAVVQYQNSVDLIVMAAAVADWTPETVRTEKWKKSGEHTSLPLVRTRDILMEISNDRRPSRIVVGFAAETGDVMENAERKCAAKHLDAIVANRVGVPDGGFESDQNSGVFLTAAGNRVEIPLSDKRRMADRILDCIRDQLISLFPDNGASKS
ncbi:MAG TPA: bifunctional phosphopantothenoylcysteine decarboxylase/phosphopantothenate--cysteine ligase CoaBC [bacterium]|nr:bifunctional phosphopantothenoylcysteine decarboxylase/phosphopantothenate--cysteine ligase CoaBC [bacterium]